MAGKKQPLQNGWIIPRDWEGETVVCIASGPSLTKEDVEYVRGRAKVIAINTSGEIAPWADELYFCDRKWWNWHHEKDWLRQFDGRIIKGSLDDRDRIDELDIRHLLFDGDHGMPDEPDRVAHGRNSGYAAIQIAYKRGASKIILLGYDMGFEEGKRSHFFGAHPVPNRQSTYEVMRQRYPSLATALRGKVTVINCSRETRLDCFPKMKLEDALCE